MLGRSTAASGANQQQSGAAGTQRVMNLGDALSQRTGWWMSKKSDRARAEFVPLTGGQRY